jgi:hypothetical protein
MKILLDKSPAIIQQQRERFGDVIWQLRTPLTRYKLAGCPYGLDNGAFTRFDEATWLRLVAEAREVKPLFVCLPDIVGSARRTLELFDAFKPATLGVPRALVLQDGIGDFAIPWTHLDAVFIGGSDKFKTSEEAFSAARAAKILGKWVHVGRINGAKRVEQWRGVADSCDGSGMSRAAAGDGFDRSLEDVVQAIRNDVQQMSILEGIA